MPIESILHIILVVAVSTYVIFCGITDYVTQTLPVWPAILFYPLLLIDVWFNFSAHIFYERFVIAIVCAVLFLINALFWNGGGGDVIFLPLVPLTAGAIEGIIIIAGGCLLSAGIYACRIFFTEKRKVQGRESAPLLPGVSIVYWIAILTFAKNALLGGII